MAGKTAVKTEVQPAQPVLPQEVGEYNPALEDWSSLTSNADQVLGHDLAKDDLLDALVGVPFIITKVTFRPGFVRDGKQMAYASFEAVIAPEEVLRKRRVKLDVLPFEPGDMVIFNDGSTGMYRQMVGYLSATSRIILPEDLPENGGYGESRYDLPPNDWTEILGGESQFSDDGFLNYEVNVRLSCPRGLRLSEYTNDHNPAGSKTRYFG